MNLHLIFNHKLTPEQIQDAKESLNIKEIFYLPNNLQQIWSNIPPDKNLDLKKHLEPIINYLSNFNNDYVLIQGDFGAVHYVVKNALFLKHTPIYATTERKTIEEKLSDNTITTKRIFKHVCFRKFI